MKIIHVEQGSLPWLLARCGIPTASCFKKIVTPKTLKSSASRIPYMHELCAEWLCGPAVDDLDTTWMKRGRELEPKAALQYAMLRDVEPVEAGFCLTDEGTVGCSPDRLVGQDGLLEIKCPSPKVHLSSLLNGGIEQEHRCQLQGCLWVTGCSWIDAMSYHPTLPPSIVRVERDEAFQAALDEHLPAFVTELAEMRGKLEALGCVRLEATSGTEA